MEYITLKNSDLRVSRLCMGGCPMGGYGWGEVYENELIDAVHEAIDKGINFFDTADTYGLGQSERTLGKALGDRRKDVIIATKFGVCVDGGKTVYENSPQYIKNALKNSLMRLGTDYIDLYQIHYRDNLTPISDVIGTLEQLQKEGYIRYFGISNIKSETALELEPYKGKLVSFQDEYSLACRKNEADIFDIAETYSMTPLTWGSLGQGILTGKYNLSNISFGRDDRRSRAVYVNFHGEKLLQNLKTVEVLKRIAAEHEKPVSAVAIRFILDYIPESAALVGIKRPSQLIGNLEAVDWHLSGEETDELCRISG